jgi:hypothetical protein
MTYQPDKPHGVAIETVSATATSFAKQMNKITAIPALKNGTEKLHLLNEALARARMRDLWREEHRHRRKAGQILRDVRRSRRVH